MTHSSSTNPSSSGTSGSLLPFRRAIPQILLYQLLSSGIFSAVMLAYRQLTGLILWNIDRPAFTSGDLPYLLRTWQGWVLVLLGFLALVLYTVFDINATVLLSDRILRGERIRVLPLLRESLASLRRFRGPAGILTILYVSLIAPLAGGIFGISLTRSFTVPNFILSVIRANALYHAAYLVGITLLGVLGFVFVFTFDFILLGRQDVREAMASSKRLMRAHWRSFLVQYVVFCLKWLVPLIALVGGLYVLPCVLMSRLPLGQTAHHAGIIFFSALTALGLILYALFFDYFLQMKLTQLYYAWTGQEISRRTLSRRPHRPLRTAGALVPLLLLLFTGVVSFAAALYFDALFPRKVSTGTIAHRAGGTLANENTVLALDAAVRAGADGAEVDVQRTKDGHYIINHDSTFERVCGDPRTPGEMTLAQIRELRVRNLPHPLQPDTSVATMEEMLDAARGRIHLYIELKGESADTQMAEDVIRMAGKRGMLDQVTLISLNYRLIDAIESAYPKVQTGYLCYFSFGSIEKLHCDAILMEEEVATSPNIDRIHRAGKQAGVWTVNTTSSMTDFLSGEADWVITDEVRLAAQIRRLLESYTDEARVFTAICRLMLG